MVFSTPLGFIPIGSVLTFWFGFLLISLFTFKIGSFTFWQPYPKTSFQVQLSGTIDTTVKAKVFILNGLNIDQGTISTLQGLSRKVVCQVSLGTVSQGTEDYDVLTPGLLGNQLPNGDYYADIRSPSVMRIMENRLDAMAAKNCDAVDGTFVDSWARDSGFSIVAEDQLRYNLWIVNSAHSLGLSIGLHGDADQVSDLDDYYDFAVTESCYANKECEKFLPFIEEGKAVFNIEYNTSSKDKVQICEYANEMDLSIDIKSLQLGSDYQACQ